MGTEPEKKDDQFTKEDIWAEAQKVLDETGDKNNMRFLILKQAAEERGLLESIVARIGECCVLVEREGKAAFTMGMKASKSKWLFGQSLIKHIADAKAAKFDVVDKHVEKPVNEEEKK